jgi:hypothetical protein
MAYKDALRLPVLSAGAEFIAMGYLMRRNVLAYRAPPNNQGYDLICIHPDPRQATRQIRIQVKTRYATDSNRGVPVKSKTLDAFDYLMIVYQNIGCFYRKSRLQEGPAPIEILTLPNAVVERFHERRGKGWEVFYPRGFDLDPYLNETGIELIARDLRVPYPRREGA